MAKAYDKTYFDKWRAAGIVDFEATKRAAKLAVTTAEYVLERPPRTVLDIGCGECLWRRAIRDAIAVHDHVAASHLRYTAIDPSAYVVKTQANVFKGGFGDLPALSDWLGISTLDLVVCNDVLPYVSADDMNEGLAWIAPRLVGVAWLQAMTKSDEFEGDREGFIARSAAQYLAMFKAHGLHRIGPHLYIHERTLSKLTSLER